MADQSGMFKMTISHDARLEVLEDRFERHSEKWDVKFDTVIRELKEIRDLYHHERNDFISRVSKLENEFVQKTNKIYFTIIIALIGVVWQIAWEYLVRK